jgi:hypothetical protein
MTSRSFDYDAIWLKAVTFINRALDDTDDFDEKAFWAAGSLELLGKAALTKVNPALIADITADGNALLIAAGLHDDASTFVSVQAKTVFKRCQSLAKQFDFGRALKIAANRNGYLHSGAPFCTNIPASSWWEKYWPLVSILLAAQGKELADFVGADNVQEIKQILTRSKQHAEQRCQTLIDRASLAYQRLQRGELPTAEIAAISTRVSGHFPYSTTTTCPACSNPGALRGSTTLNVEDIFDYDEEDNYIYTVSEVASEEYGCRHCGLLLRGPDAISYANMPASFEFRDEGPDEPEYGND